MPKAIQPHWVLLLVDCPLLFEAIAAPAAAAAAGLTPFVVVPTVVAVVGGGAVTTTVVCVCVTETVAVVRE
jgi:hypothetical protein